MGGGQDGREEKKDKVGHLDTLPPNPHHLTGLVLIIDNETEGQAQVRASPETHDPHRPEEEEGRY